MNYDKLVQFASEPRLSRFLISCAYSKDRAVLLYAANVSVAQAFYPILNLFEIFLRNSINERLNIYFEDKDWIINQKSGFMNHSSLKPKFWIKTQILKAEKAAHGIVTADKVISEQTLGFWTCLFEPKHYKLIGGNVIHCFPNKPSAINRVYIAAALKDVRTFRNRVYHNEAICFKELSIDFTHAKYIKTIIYNLLEWIDADLKDYVNQFDTIDKAIEQALAI